MALPGSHLQRHGLKTVASFVALGASKRGVQRAATAAAAGRADAATAATTGSDGETEGHLGCVVRVGKEEIGGQLVVVTQQGLVKALPLGLLLPTGTKKKSRTRRLLPLGLGDAVAACAVVKKRPTKSDRDAQAIKAETDTDLGTGPETEARNGVHEDPNKSAESQEQTETLGEAKGENDYSVVLGGKTLLSLHSPCAFSLSSASPFYSLPTQMFPPFILLLAWLSAYNCVNWILLCSDCLYLRLLVFSFGVCVSLRLRFCACVFAQ